MALLFAENGLSVSLEDPSEKMVDSLIEQAKKLGLGDKLSKHEDYKSLCESLDSPKVFFLSLPHGTVGDTVVDGLKPYLERGDIFVDCGNENWENTQRRQGKLVSQGVDYIGCGVSGGYQAARRGPSMCPGGPQRALDIVLPFLEKVAAKDAKGRPCVARAGEGGAGHYVKMVHNGIEQGMMSAISEAWTVMNKHMGMSYEEIGKVFDKWNSEGELVSILCRSCLLYHDQKLTPIRKTPFWSRSVATSAKPKTRMATRCLPKYKTKWFKTPMKPKELASGPTPKPPTSTCQHLPCLPLTTSESPPPIEPSENMSRKLSTAHSQPQKSPSQTTKRKPLSSKI